jgi:hypothetical protein
VLIARNIERLVVGRLCRGRFAASLEQNAATAMQPGLVPALAGSLDRGQCVRNG